MNPLDALDALVADVPGTVSVWYGPPGGDPVYTRAAGETHYAASTMKAAVLAAMYRLAEAGAVDLSAPVAVVNDFASAASGRFACRQSYDNDDAVWERLGSSVPLRWLAERMIVRSSNLATNLVLSHVGLDAVASVWRDVGAKHSVVGRGIEDSAASTAGITNLVTAADLAALLGALAGSSPSLASPASCRSMLDTLLAQEYSEDLASGLPPGTKVAHKNGWIPGVRHGAGIVYPDHAPPFVLVVCTTTPWAENDANDRACALVAQIASIAYTAWSA